MLLVEVSAHAEYHSGAILRTSSGAAPSLTIAGVSWAIVSLEPFARIPVSLFPQAQSRSWLSIAKVDRSVNAMCVIVAVPSESGKSTLTGVLEETAITCGTPSWPNELSPQQ